MISSQYINNTTKIEKMIHAVHSAKVTEVERQQIKIQQKALKLAEYRNTIITKTTNITDKSSENNSNLQQRQAFII